MSEQIRNFKRECLVRNVNNTISYHTDEFVNLIFITPGSVIRREHTYDWETGLRNGSDEVEHVNAVDILTGERMGWSSHMFMTLDEFFTWVHNMKYLTQLNPLLLEKIKNYDDDDNGYDKQLDGMCMCNSIIECAKIIYKGLDSDEIIISSNISSIYANEIKKELDERPSRIRTRAMHFGREDGEHFEDFDPILNPYDTDLMILGRIQAKHQIINAVKLISEIEPFDIKLKSQIEQSAKVRAKSEEEEVETEEDDND